MANLCERATKSHHTIPKIHHRDRRVLDYDELYELYVTRQLSAHDIAKIKGTQRWWIYDRLMEYGIPRTLNHPQSIEKQRQALLGRPNPSNTKIKRGQHLSLQTEFKKGQRPSIKAIEASHRAHNKSPNKVEKRLQAILDKSFPGEYTYAGDGSFLIHGICPDFVNCNGQKKVIEVFGDYWHSDKKVRTWKETELGRTMQYNSLGFGCLVLWENDVLNKPESELIKSISGFNTPKKKGVVWGKFMRK